MRIRKKGKMIDCLPFIRKNYHFVIVHIPLVLVIAIVLSLAYHILLPISYLILVALLAALIGVLVVIQNRCGREFLFISNLGIIKILICNIYNISMGYNVLQFGDPYWELGITRTYYLAEKIFVIGDPSVPSRLRMYSGWPLLNSMSVILADVTALDLFHIALMLPSIFTLISFILFYIFAKMTIGKKTTLFLALIFYTFCPDIYMLFTKQSLAILWMLIIFYCVLKRLIKRSYQYSLLLVLFSVATILTHHFTSLVMISYFILLFFASKFLFHFNKHNKLNSKFSQSLLHFFFISAISTFVWWNYVAIHIWSWVKNFLERFANMFELLSVTSERYAVEYPSSLTPVWALLLPWIRYFVLYIPALFGFLFLCKKRNRTTNNLFVVSSLLAFGLFSTISMVVWSTLSRHFLFFVPFASICAAIFYERLSLKLKDSVSRTLIVTLIAILVFSSFVGIWTHRYAPIHLYDPSIDQVRIGEHNIYPIKIKKLFDDCVNYDSVDVILTDSIYSQLLITPTGQWFKIQMISEKWDNYGKEMLIIEFREFYIYKYYDQLGDTKVSIHTSNILASRLRSYVSVNFNLVINQGNIKVWRSLNNTS